MTIQLQRVGGELRLVIPDDLAARAGFGDGAELSVSAELGRLVAEAGTAPRYTLDELLRGTTADDLHGEADWGRPAGKERFWE